MKGTCTILALLVFCLLNACTSIPNNSLNPVNRVSNFARHAITINGEGNILTPNIAHEKGEDSDNSTIRFSPIESKEFAAHVERLFDAARNSSKDNILIFIHGGLNTLSDSTARVERIINEYEKTQMGSYYPILINWDSGLFESYGEHLFNVRQGGLEWWGAPTSPLYFAADAGRSLVRAPIDILYTSYRDLETIPFIENVTNKYQSSSDRTYHYVAKHYPANISRGKDLGWGVQTFWKVPINVITWPIQLLVSPVIDGFGTPAWENMLRRTKVLYNKPEEFNINRDEPKAGDPINGLPPAAMSIFAEHLSRYAKCHPKTTITIAGHSMGTIIINELIRRYPEIHYRNIIYMAGADSVRNTIASVMPYLKNASDEHRESDFYNLTLHPQNDLEESNAFYLAPRGSLLVWIDDFFSTPHTQSDRTVGRWENLIKAYGEIPSGIRERIYLKAFDQDSPISKHGDFSRAAFWDESFWKPNGLSSKTSSQVRLID